MSRTRRQSTLSRSGSDWASDSDTSVLPRSPSPDREPPEHIPRPSNSFILYRGHILRKRQEELERNGEVETMANYGKYIGPKWRSEPPEVKAYWNGKAEEAKREHSAKYPDYEYRPNRGSRPKRAPCKPKRQTTERKVATLGPTERSMKTRSMAEQREAAAARINAQEKKTNVDSGRETTTHPGGNQETRSMSRSASVQSDVAHPEAVQVQDHIVSAMAQAINHQRPVEPQLAGVETGLPSDWVLPPQSDHSASPSMFDLFSAPAGDPVVDHTLLAQGWQAPETFNENVAPADPNSTHAEHDRPSLWESDLPLFPREILEEDYHNGHYEAQGIPADWSFGQPTQATFLPEFGLGSSQPLTSSLLANWPLGDQYFCQQLGLYLKGGVRMHE